MKRRKTPDSKRRARISRQCLTRLEELKREIGGTFDFTALGQQVLYFRAIQVLIIYNWSEQKYYIYHSVGKLAQWVMPIAGQEYKADKIAGVENLFRLKGWTHASDD